MAQDERIERQSVLDIVIGKVSNKGVGYESGGTTHEAASVYLTGNMETLSLRGRDNQVVAKRVVENAVDRSLKRETR